MALIPSGTINVTASGQIVENREVTGFINIDSGSLSNITIRNCWVKHPGGEAGIFAQAVNNLTIQDCKITNTSAPSGQNPLPAETINIKCNNISGQLNIARCTLRGASGIYVVISSAAINISFLEGWNIRGPDFIHRAQLVQLNQCTGSVLIQDFSCINDPNNSAPQDLISIYECSGASKIIRRGHLDGNTGPAATMVMVENNSSGTLIEDVDAIRFMNGAFAVYDGSNNVIYRNCRCRDQIMFDQGRGPPSSDGGAGPIVYISSPGVSGTRFEQNKYWNVNTNNLLWYSPTVSVFDVAAQNFTMRAPIVNSFGWESGNALIAIGQATSSPVIGPATLGGEGIHPLTAADIATTAPFIGPGPSGIGGTVNLFAGGLETPGANTLGNAPVFTGTVGASRVPTGWTVTGSQDACNTVINPGTVNGITTLAVSVRQVAPGGWQGFQHSFTWTALQKYKITVWLRIPTGVTASRCYLYYGSDVRLIASNTVLNAQTKDVWFPYSIDHTATGSENAIISFINPSDGTNTGFDIALPTVQPYSVSGSSLFTSSPVFGTPAISVSVVQSLFALPVIIPGPNILADSVFVGGIVGGSGTLPDNWNFTGNDSLACSVINTNGVDGVTTRAVAVRGTNISFQGLQHVFTWTAAEKYRISAWLRLPTGVAASRCTLYMGADPVLFVDDSELMSMPRDSWNEFFVDWVATGIGGSFISFINPADGVGTGFDIALPTIQQFIGSGSAIAPASPSIGKPIISVSIHALVASSLEINSLVVIGPAVLSQDDIIVASSLMTSVPFIGAPELNGLVQPPIIETAFVLGDTILDLGLNAFTLADKIIICAFQPADYDDAISLMIGEKDLGVGNVLSSGPVDAAPGRKVITTAIVDGDILVEGVPTCWAVIDEANLRLLATGPMSGLQTYVEPTDTFTLGAITITWVGEAS